MKITLFIPISSLLVSILIFACRQPSGANGENTLEKMDSVKVCQCIETIRQDSVEKMQESMANCIRQYGGKSKMAFHKILLYSYTNCPVIFQRIHRESYKKYNLDTLPWRNFEPKDFEIMQDKKFYDLDAKEKSYSILKNDTLYFYFENKLKQQFIFLDSHGINSRLFCIYDRDHFLPPFKGDTMKFHYLKICDSLIKVTQIIRNTAFISYSFFKPSEKDNYANK